MNIQPTEEWAQKDEDALLKKQLKYKDGKANMMDVILNDDETVEPSEESQLVYHKPYSQMTEKEKAQLAIDRLNFLFKNTKGVGMRPDVSPTTVQDIYNTGYLDVWIDRSRQFSLENMPTPDELEQQRWEINKDDNMRKMWKTFGKTMVDGFKKSLASWAYMFGRYDDYKPEQDMTGTIWDVLENGYTPMVNDPAKAGKKFTKEYWMNQFAQMGTSVGMAGEMVLEGLVMHGLSNMFKLKEFANLLRSGMINNASKIEKYQYLNRQGRAFAGRGDFKKANEIISRRMDDAAISMRNTMSALHDYAEGGMIAWKNATLNYQYNVNEEYTRLKNGGMDDNQAIKFAHEAAWDTFKVEIYGSMAINIAQSRILNSLVRSRFDNALKIINSAANAERLSAETVGNILPKISTKGLFAKNAGKFVLGQLTEGAEEVWEDSMAMWGRQKAYLSNKDLYDSIGLSYYMSDEMNTLVDSFIGGVMGGALLSGARVGFNAAVGKSETKLQRKQIEMYNIMAENFQNNINSAAFSYIDQQKKLAILEENYLNNKPIKDKNGNEVKYDDSRYKQVYEQQKNDILDTSNQAVVLFQTIENARTAIKMVMAQLEGNASMAVTQNIDAINNRIAAINELLSNADSSGFNANITEYNREQYLLDQINKLESENKDATAQKNELDALHAKWEKQGITDEMKHLEGIFNTLGAENFKDNNGNIVVPDKQILENELQLANKQLVVTNAFNNAFYNYVTGINTDLNAAVKYASNEAFIYISQMQNDVNVDNILSKMKLLFDNIGKNMNVDGEYFTGKRQRVAWAYAMFKKMNSNNQYDNLLQTLVSYMAQDAGMITNRDDNGVVIGDFDKAFDLESLQNNPDKYMYQVASEYSGHIKQAVSNLKKVKNFGKFEELSRYRATISLFQDIFNDSEQGRFKGLRDYITERQYKVLVDDMNKGNYKKMLEHAEQYLKNMKDNVKQRGKKLKESIDIVNSIKQDVKNLEEKEKQLNTETDSTILDTVVNIDELNKSIKTLDEETDAFITKGIAKNNDEYKNKLNELKKLKDRKTAYELAKKALKKGSLADYMIVFNDISKKIAVATPKYSEELLHEQEKAERLADLNKGDIDKTADIISDIIGDKTVNDEYINSLDITDEQKKSLTEQYLKSKNDWDIVMLKINICKAILSPKEVTISEDEKKAFEEAKGNIYTASVISETQSILDAVSNKKDEIANDIFNIKNDIEKKNKEIEDKESSYDWKESVRLMERIDVLKKEYPSDEELSEQESESKKDALSGIANFQKFFDRGDSEAAVMLNDIRQASLGARKSIEYVNSLGKENAALMTKEGQFAYSLRENMYDVAKMPELTSRQIKRKLNNYVKLYHLLLRRKKLNKSENFKTVFDNAQKELEAAIIDTYNIYEASKTREDVSERIKEDNEKRNKSERVFSILESTLDENELKKFADMDKSDFESVIKKLEELQEDASDDRKKEIHEAIVAIRAERDKYNVKDFDDIVKNQTAGNNDNKQDEEAKKVTRYEDLEIGTLYYFKNSDEDMANRIATDSGIDNVEYIEAIPGEQASFMIRINEDEYIQYDDQGKQFSKAIVVESTEEGEERTVGAKTKENKEITSFQLQNDELSHIAQTVYNHESSETLSSRYGKIINVVNGLRFKGYKYVDIPNTVIDLNNNNDNNDNNEDDSADGIKCRDYVKQLLGLDSDLQADIFIKEIVYNIISSSKNRESFFNSISLRYKPENISLDGYTASMLYKDVASVYAEKRFGIESDNFVQELENYINKRAISYTGNISAQTFYETNEAKKETSNLEVSEGVTVASNEASYRGDQALSVHQNYTTKVIKKAVKKKNGEYEYEAIREPRFVDENGNSLITEKGLEQLEKIRRGESTSINIETDIKKIYDENVNISSTDSDENDTLFHRMLKVNGLPNSWEEVEKLSDEKMKKAKEIIADCAVIKVYSNGICIGFLPMRNHYTLKNTYIRTEDFGGTKLFTNNTISEAREKCKRFNDEIENFRNSIVDGNPDKEFDNLTITQSTENGELEDYEGLNSDMEFSPRIERKPDILFVGNIPYALDKETNRKRAVVLPGYSGIQVNNNGTYNITYISDENYEQKSFILSESMPAVHYDAKAKLCHILLQLVADYAKINPAEASNIIVNNSKVFEQICGNINNLANTDHLEKLGSEKFDLTKKLLQDYFDYKDGDKAALINNSNTDDLYFGNHQQQFINLFVIGGTGRDKENTKYFDVDFSKGFNFFLGNKKDKERTGIINFDFNGENINGRIQNIIDMMFKDKESSDISNLDRKLNTLEVRYTTLWKSKKPLNGFELNAEPVEKPENEQNKGIINDIDIYNPEFSINSTKTDFLEELNGKIQAESASFTFITNVNDKTSKKLPYAQINIGFGEHIKQEDKLPVVERNNEENNVESRPLNNKEDFIPTTLTLEEEAETPIDLSKDSAVPSSTDDETPNFHIYWKKEWGFNENEALELSKSIYAKLIDLILNPSPEQIKQGKKAKSRIGDITKKDIELELEYFLGKARKFNAEKKERALFTIFNRFNKDDYDNYETFSSGVMSEYPFLNQKSVYDNAKKYFDGELSYDTVMNEKSVNNWIFWSKFLNNDVQKAMFDKDGFFNIIIANMYNSTDNIVLLEDNAFDDESEGTSMLESVQWDYNDHNTVPLVSTLSSRTKLFLGTIKKLQPKTDKDDNIVTINDKIQFEYQYTTDATTNIALPEIYDQHEVINFLREIGTRNKTLRWSSILDEIKKMAQGNGNNAPLAYSILQALENLNDSKVILEIKYKMGTKAKCRFRYLSINDIEKYDSQQQEKYSVETHISRLNSKSESAGALYYDITENVFLSFDTMMENLSPLAMKDNMKQFPITVNVGNDVVYSNEFKEYVRYYTNEAKNWPKKQWGEFGASKNLYALLSPFKNDKSWNEDAIKKDTDKFNIALENVQKFFEQIYGYKFDLKSLKEVGYEHIDNIIKRIHSVVNTKTVYIDETDKQGTKKNVPVLMRWKHNASFSKLCGIEVKYNNLIDDIIVKSGGVNVNTDDDRTFADWQVMDIQDESTEIHKFLMEQNTWKEGKNNDVCSWFPQLCGEHVFDKEFCHGLNDISVCRYKGEFSKKLTQLNESDQMFVKTLMYFNTTNFNWDTDMHYVNVGKIGIMKARYATVPDLTDSNKSKSAYWRLLSVIPKVNRKFDGDITRNAVDSIDNAEELFNYVHNALLVSEIERISKVIGIHKDGEQMIFSNMTYNKLRFNAPDGKEYSLLEYINGIDSINKNERVNFLRKTLPKLPQARQMTIDIINDKLEDITGVTMSRNNRRFEFRVNDEKVKESLWFNAGIIGLEESGKVDYRKAKINDSGKSYSKNINELTDSTDVFNQPRLYYTQAAVDFVFNTLVHDHFILDVMYGGAFNFVESNISALDLSIDKTKTELDNFVDKINNKLRDNVYKRMAGVLTGGNKVDYSVCYPDGEWGKDDKFLYLNCSSVEHSFSNTFDYYIKLYYGKMNKEQQKAYDDFVANPESNKYYKKNADSRIELMRVFPKIAAYLDIDWTDGQEFCSWREAIDTMYAKGAIEKYEYDELKETFSNWKGKSGINEERINTILRKGMQVFKPVYFGVKVDKAGEGDNVYGVRTSLDYVKSSVCPLFPNFTEGTGYDSIRRVIEAVERKKKMNVHLSFDSSVKVGGSVKNKIDYNTLERIDNVDELSDKDIEKLEESLFLADRKYYSIQNETDNKLQTKLDEKNKYREELDEDDNISKLDLGKDYYSMQFCLSTIEDEMGIDFEDRFIAKSVIDICADILAPRIMTDEQKENSDKEARKRIKGNIAQEIREKIVFNGDEVISDYYDSLQSYMLRNNITGFSKDNLRRLMYNIHNNLLYKAAWLQSKNEKAADISKRQKEIIEEQQNRSRDEQYEYIVEVLNNNNQNEKPVKPSEFDAFIDRIIGDGGIYSKALEKEDELDRLYYDMSENIELKTVELTQLEHMLTSNGISRIKERIFTIPKSVVSKEMMDILPNESLAQFSEGENYRVDGETLENIRNAFEITESFNNMVNLLYDKKNGFGILSKKDYNTLEKTRDVTSLNALLNRKDVQLALKKRIMSEMSSRGSGTNAIDLIDENVPLFMNPSLLQIENMLMALIKKNISRTYLTGSSFFLMSSLGMKMKKSDQELSTINDIIWLDRNRGTQELRATFKTNEKGKKELVMAECAIAPQFTYFDKGKNRYDTIDFHSVDKDGNYVYLVGENGERVNKNYKGALYMANGKIDPEVLKIISLRVPTSGLMNSCAMKIVAFLPSNMSSTIIVPKEHIAQFGEDFDIDKRFCYLRNWIVKNGNVELLQEHHITNFMNAFSNPKYKRDKRVRGVIKSMNNKLKANRLIDIYMSVLSNPDDKVQKKINNVLAWQELKDTKDLIISCAPKSQNGILRGTGDIRTQTELCYKSSSGQRGTGAWSNKIVFTAILSKVKDGVVMQEVNNDVTNTVKIIMGSGKNLEFNGNLSSENTISDSKDYVRTKMEVDAAQQNVNLDTVKEDIIAWINQNGETLPFFMMMSFLGYDLTDNINFYKMTRDPQNGYVYFDKNLNTDDRDYSRVDIASMIAVQPIIRRFTELEMQRKSIRRTYQSNLDITIQLLKEFGFTDEQIKDMQGNQNYNIESLGEFKNFRISARGTLEKESKNGIHDYHIINGQILYQNMYRPAKQIAENDLLKFQQLCCLSLFSYVRIKGYELQKYRNLVTINSRGIGKTYMDVKDKITALNDLGKQQTFRNLTDMIGIFKPKIEYTKIEGDGFYDIPGCDYYIKPTTAEGNNLIMSLIAAESIVGNAIGYSGKMINKMLSRFNDVFRENYIYQEEKERMQRRVIHDTQIYFLLMLDSICKKNGKEGLFKSYEDSTYGYTIELERARLIKSVLNSLGKDKKKDYEAIGVDTTFFNVFATLMRNKPKTISDKFFSHFSLRENGTIDFRVKANQTFDRLSFQNALLDMWDSDKNLPVHDTKGNYPYTQKEFVKDIIALAYVMDDRQGINNFKDLIPVKILDELGLVDAMKTVGDIMDGGKEELFERCFDQILVNNAERLLPNSKKIRFASNSKKTDYIVNVKGKNMIDALMELGISNPNYNEKDPEMEPMYLRAFRSKTSNDKKIAVYFFDYIDSDGNIHYKVKVLEKREGSGKNTYNPFLDTYDSVDLTTTKEERNDNLDNVYNQNRIKDDADTVSKLDSILRDENGNSDPFVKLLDAVLKRNLYKGFSVRAIKTENVGKNPDAIASVQRTSYPANLELRYKSGLANMKNINEKRMIFREEIMHCLLIGYLDGKFDANGNVVESSGITDRFKNSLDIFKKLRQYYLSENVWRRYHDDKGNAIIPQLDNIFRSKNSERMLSFNEFLANIMSGDTSLNQLIHEYIESQGYESKQEKDTWFNRILDSILDFIVETFRKICGMSGIHNDVANEVMRMVTDIYLTNNEDEVAVDKIDMMKRFGEIDKEVKSEDLNAMKKVLDDVQKANSQFDKNDMINVTDFAEGIFRYDGPSGESMFEIPGGEKVAYTDVGDFIDNLCRKAFASKKYGRELVEELKKLNTWKDGKFVLSNSTIEAIAALKGRVLASAGMTEYADSSKFKLISNFTINGKHIKGIPDLTIVDNKNNVFIIDFKTMKQNDSKKSIFDIREDLGRLSKVKRYTTQLELYRMMFEEKLAGMEKVGLNRDVKVHTMIFEFGYTASKANNNTVSIDVNMIQGVDISGLGNKIIEFEKDIKNDGNFIAKAIENANSSMVESYYDENKKFSQKINKFC